MNLKEKGFSEKLALSALLIFLSGVAAAMIGFAFGASLSPLTAAIAAAALLGISFFCDKKLFLGCLVNFALLGIFALVCRYMFDWSYDGMYYHKQAVITLKEGWNPLYKSSLDCDVFASYPNMALWLDNYPKGLWIFSAIIYSVTGHLETAKAVNILFISALFFAGVDLLKNTYNFSKGKSLFFAFILIINPVFLSQALTFYNDLTVGVLTALAVIFCLKLYRGTASLCTYMSIAAITLISPLIKFTSPGLLAIIYIVFGTACALKHKDDLKWLIKPVSVIICSFIVSLSLFGFDPYVEHIMNGQHLLHPAAGKDKYDIMNTNPPKGFENLSGVERVLISVFSKSSNVIEEEPQLKIPFSVSKSEFKELANPDTRIGGFGIFFSAALCLSAATLAAFLIMKNKLSAETGIVLAMLLILTLFFPQSWWARYASFIYYLPVCAMIAAVREKRLRLFVGAISVVFIVNSAVTAASVISAGLKTTEYINSKLAEIKAENKKIVVRVNDFPTHVKLFEEAGIDFEISHKSIAPGEEIFYRNTKYKYID